MKLMTKKQVRIRFYKKMFKIITPIFIFIGAIIVLYIMYRGAMLAQIDPQINFIIGDGFYKGTDASTWEKASVGVKLKEGYYLKTGQGSSMEILMQNGTAMRMKENAQMKMAAADTSALSFFLKKGELLGKFKKLIKNQDIIIKTPTAVASVRGTELKIISSRSDESSSGYCLTGLIEFYNPKFPGEAVELKPETKSQISQGKKPEKADSMTEDEIQNMKKEIASIKMDKMLFMTNKINFATGSSEIQSSSIPELDKIYKMLDDEEGNILIAGHSDSQGTSESNKKLSLERAEAIKEYFIKKGMEADRAKVKGYGSDKPIYSNDTVEGRSGNRRVEFVLIKD